MFSDMSEAAAELRVAGQTYRVVTSAGPQELNRLAAVVEEALSEVTAPGRQPSAQSLVLAAISLAHELEVEKQKVQQLQERQKRVLSSLLGRVDQVLAETEGDLADAADAAHAKRGSAAQSSSPPR